MRDAAIAQESNQPAGAREDLRQKGNLAKDAAHHQFFHAIAGVAFAHSRDRRVDGDHESRKACGARAGNGTLGRSASAHQIKLIPGWTSGRAFDIFQAVPRDRRENVSRARCSRAAGRCDLALRMHQAAVTNRRQHDRKSQIESENTRAQIASGHRDSMPRTKCHIFKCAAIFPERELALRAAVEIVKHNARQPPARQRPQVRNAHDPR